MRRSLLSALCFTALAAIAALAVGRVADPPMTRVLLGATIAATVAGGVGILGRRSWPLALFLLPLGAYLLARLQVGLPGGTTGAGAHLAYYLGRVADGASVYARQSFPLDPAARDLRLLFSLVVYAVVGVAALLALGLRRPLAAVVLLLCLTGFGFTVDAGRDAWSALAFVALAAGLLTLSHPLPRERLRLADAFAGGLTATIAILLALSVLGTTTVEAGRPLRDWRTWDLAGPGDELMRFDWMQNYPRLLARANDAPVMEVRSPVASYWRANVLTVFTGLAWRGDQSAVSLTPNLLKGSWTYAVPRASGGDAQERIVVEHFDVRNTFTDHLFVGGWANEVRSPLPLDLGSGPGGDISVTPPRGPSTQYEVVASVPNLAATDLIGRGDSYPPAIASTSLQLPFPAKAVGDEQAWRRQLANVPGGQEWAGLYRLDERAIGSQRDPYLVAQAIESYLRGDTFRYTLRPPASRYSSPYAAFLFDTHAGYCQQFAGAMALLLRFNGIPARVVVGFTEGEQAHKGVFLVRRNDAHAWVEAYFPDVGWAPFEPTPGRALPADTSIGAAGQGAPSSEGAGSTAAGRAGGVDLPGRARVNDPGGPGEGGIVAPPAPNRVPWLLVPLAVVVIWPAGRALLRRRGLLAPTPEARLRAAVRSLYGTLGDHGVQVPRSQTLDETTALLRSRFGLDAGDVPARVQAVLFGGRSATDADVAELRRFRRRLAARLRERDSLRERIASLYGLRQARPLSPRAATVSWRTAARERSQRSMGA